jgi:hypothetical protein
VMWIEKKVIDEEVIIQMDRGLKGCGCIIVLNL